MTTLRKRGKRKRGVPAFALVFLMGGMATGAWYAGFFLQGLFNVQVHRLLDLPGTRPEASAPPAPPEEIHLN